MFWQEEEDQEHYRVPERVQELSFSIRCKSLPVDHSAQLASALLAALPWLDQVEGAGVHQIHVAESGNGWERPQEATDRLYLSRRTKLTLRLPSDLLTRAADELTGQCFEVAGEPLEVREAAAPRLLSLSATLYARHVVSAPQQDEEAFIAWAVAQLRGAGLRFTKVLCGKEHRLGEGASRLLTRSLLISGLSHDDSVRLQELGLGPERLRGCGLFIPHKPV